MPEIAANTLFINNKKEELLKRQVNVWKTQVRGKKDRREVRMLGNWHIYFLIRHVFIFFLFSEFILIIFITNRKLGVLDWFKVDEK